MRPAPRPPAGGGPHRERGRPRERPPPDSPWARFPEPLVEAYAPLLGGRDGFLREFSTVPRRAFRVNTLKATVPEVSARLRARGFPLEPVPWCDHGFFTEGKFGPTPEGALGYLYGQDAASMLPALALEPGPGERVLDMCAAPGSKTTHLAALMGNEGRIVANDRNRDRAYALIAALQRCGVTNALVTVHDATSPEFQALSFDRVLVDAPCSGLGRAGSSDAPLRAWSGTRVGRFVEVQTQLLEAAHAVLRPGGVLVYGTCTLEPRENEGVTDAFLRAHDDVRLEPLPFAVPGAALPVPRWHGDAYSNDLRHVLRLHPSAHRTEGFYVARFRRD